MKKIFVQGYWNENLGDDLFLKVLCDRYPKQNFYIFGLKNKLKSIKLIDNVKILKTYIPATVFRILDKINFKMNGNFILSTDSFILNRIKNFDAYVELGGSIFMMPPDTMDFKYKIRKKILHKDINYLFIGSNFGPYYNDFQVKNYNNLFKKIYGGVFRDKESFNLFKENKNISYAPDVVFNLVDRNAIKNKNYMLVSVISLKRKLGSSKLEQKYINYLANQLNNVIQNEHKKIVLMSFCDSEGDRLICNKIKSKIKNHKFVYIYSHKNIYESLKLIREADKIIATRYHAMILGWLYEKPTFVLSYSNKTINVINDIFPEQKFINLDDFKDFQEMNFSIISDEALLKAKNRAENQFQYLDHLIL